MSTKAFSGGDALTAKLMEIANKIGKTDTVNVGFLEGATYPDGTPIALIAATNEFGGTVTVPAHDVTVNRNIGKNGEFKNGGKFVKADKANFSTTHHVEEYTITIPARPYFRGMIAANKDGWGDQLGKIIKTADYDATVAMARLGELVKGQLQTAIRDFSDPENAKSTIAKKGFDDPLIGDSTMVNSVDYEVKE